MTLTWESFGAVVSTIAVVVTAWMAFETRRMATASKMALDVERAPVLGVKDLKIRVFNKDLNAVSKENSSLLYGVQLTLELFNAGRVPLRYEVKTFSASFANRIPEVEHYLSRGSLVLPGSSAHFSGPIIKLMPPIDAFPSKGHLSVEIEYAGESGTFPKSLKETIDFALGGAAPGSDFSWVLAPE